MGCRGRSITQDPSILAEMYKNVFANLLFFFEKRFALKIKYTIRQLQIYILNKDEQSALFDA